MNYDLKASNARKSRYLYELSRAMKGIGAAQLIAEQREAVVRLRDKLAKNEVGDPRPSQRRQRGGDADPERHPALRDGRHLFGRRVRQAMIKFIVAGLWLCAVSIGAVIYSFQVAGAKTTAEPAAALLGGLDYVKTDVLSVPVLQHGGIVGYFLTRLVYTVDPVEMKKLSVPAADADQRPGLHLPLRQSRTSTSRRSTRSTSTLFATACATASTSASARTLIHDVMIEQIDFLSKRRSATTRLRRQTAPAEPKAEKAEADGGHAEEKPAH